MSQSIAGPQDAGNAQNPDDDADADSDVAGGCGDEKTGDEDGDDGTADAKIAAGLLADIQTRVLLRQPADQLPMATELFGLTKRETALVGQLVRGRALWRLQTRGAVVQNVLSQREKRLFDTDASMSA